MKILNFGSCNIDYVYDVSHIVTKGETISVSKMEMFPGGKGLNQSIAAARAGAKIYHAGCIGSGGAFLCDTLAESGADISFLRKTDSQSGHAIIQVDENGENCILVYKGTNGMIEKSFIDEVLQNFASGDLLLIQNEINNIEYLIDRAFEKGIKIVFNPSPFCEELKAIDLNKIYCLVLNEVEIKGFSTLEKPEEALYYLKQKYPYLNIVLTLGEKGCVFTDGSEILSHPSFEALAVDTTAAGDTFTGYFVSLIAEGKDFIEAAKYASAAAALAVSKKGAAPSIPKMNDVEEALKILKVRTL